MQYGTQIGSLLTRAETQRLVVDLYKQGMPIKQIKELKAQLRAAELKACAYETMVNVAEKKFGIAIRKKHGAKQ